MFTNKLVVLDVEKANNNHASICQIGLVVIEGSKVVREFSTLVNPKQPFLSIHTSIHGIIEPDVASAPTMHDIKHELAELFSNAVVCSYGSSDKYAIGSYFDVSKIKWLDIHKMARNGLPELKTSGHALKKVCTALNLGKQSATHNALEDAFLAWQVLDHLINTVNINPKGYISQTELKRPKSQITLSL